MTYVDRVLSCRDCQADFIYSADEQEFFALKNLKNEPARCPNCRVTRKMQREGRNSDECAEVPCDDCGVITRVPFKPTGIKPVFCRYCLQKQRIKDSESTLADG